MMLYKGREIVPARFGDEMQASWARCGRAPVVLLDMGIPGLAVARHLGRAGIPVFALDTKNQHWTHASRYVEVLSSQEFRHPDRVISVVLEMAVSLEVKPVLMPLHDDYLRLVSKNRHELANYYRFVLPRPDAVECVIDKHKFYQVCVQQQLPAAQSYYPSNGEQVSQLSHHVVYPAIIKPIESRSWQTDSASAFLNGRKTVTVRNPQELLYEYERLSRIDSRLIIQEIIPGPDANLIYVVCYVRKNGDPAGFFVGRKLRTYPPHFGRGSYVESINDKQAVSSAIDVIKRLNYRGCFGIEFKVDARDGVYKLIELNGRFGMWDGFAADCGRNLIYTAYLDALDEPCDEILGNYDIGRHWLNLETDIWAAMQYIRDGEWRWFDWLASVFRADTSAINAKDDSAPMFAFWRGFSKGILRRYFKKK